MTAPNRYRQYALLFLVAVNQGCYAGATPAVSADTEPTTASGTTAPASDTTDEQSTSTGLGTSSATETGVETTAVDPGDSEDSGGASTSGESTGTGTTGGEAENCEPSSLMPTTEVNNIAELDMVIAASPESDSATIVRLNAGDYPCLAIEDLQLSADNPLILVGPPDSEGKARLVSDGCYFTSLIENSAWVVIDGLVVQGGGAGITVNASSHVVIRNAEVSQTAQEAIHIGQNSDYVDVTNSYLHDTGVGSNPQWGECVYVGTGGSAGFPDVTEYVWVAENTIANCGNGEAINVKPEVFHATVRSNDISSIYPGANGQFNMAAIAVEGARPGENYLPDTPRDIWIEHNEVTDVFFGDWANGVMFGGTGVYVVENTVSNCEERGVWANGFGDLGHAAHIFNNDVSQTAGASVDIDIAESTEKDPGENPNAPQTWFCLVRNG